MTEEENLAPSENGADKPVKKKTSVKVVRRVKSKKSEKGERPELAPPPATIDEQQQSVADESATSAQSTTTKQQVELGKQNGSATTTTTTATTTSSTTPRPNIETSRPVERRISSKRRAQRSGSNVFAMFTQNQIQQFKEAFGFIDQDKDGIISKSDIRSTFDALGRLCSDKELAEMTAEAPGPINFTMFLSVFGDRIQGTDEENVVIDAFGRFDEGDGFCKEDRWVHLTISSSNQYTINF